MIKSCNIMKILLPESVNRYDAFDVPTLNVVLKLSYSELCGKRQPIKLLNSAYFGYLNRLCACMHSFNLLTSLICK